MPRPPTTPRAEQISIARVRAVYAPVSSAGGAQQLQLERVADHRVDRPVRAGELDTETLAEQVAAVVLAS